MEITEIRIKLMESSEDRLRAFCSITIDGCFVVRDLKIIDGTNGPFVAMPSRKLTGHCNRCHHKNHLRAQYCNNCGNKLDFQADGGFDSPQKLYADVAHPINSQCRELIQNAVITEFLAELKRYEQPDYRSRYDDDFDYEDTLVDHIIEPAHSSVGPPKSETTQPPATEKIMQSDDRARQPPLESDSSEGNGDEGFGAGIF
ncbi:SpoVG family protein [Stieleria varia]|uniref:Putative septation protein SpoVG n=1 Tax=Stieleria varia TaxID=2528005 RepID=A0A5C6B166_9BACT|nr:SpoVG family protein [Stieleria varia]TWU05547.1 putative septation protein SpoVG [Stieleria varia]